MNTPSNQDLLNVCIEAAKTAGNHALKNIHRREEIFQQFAHDIKLVMDSECQQVAEQIIHSHFPDHAILGEEGEISASHELEWVIDPIDGTANYTRDFPFWCCSVAVRRNQEVLAGCVFIPNFNECYTATIDGTACCNGTPIHASSVQTLDKATFFTGLTKDIDPRSIAFFSDIAPRVSKIRMLGSAAIDLCHVACGRSDGYFEAGLYVWDIAAAGLIARRAGAISTTWPREEKHHMSFLCTTPAIHAALRDRVQTIFKI
ncbi:MAG: inositol monophosphatase [Kiritimatiellaceae bacterium]|nr:inositol monophosphatase [Kiritimatiellaceae bacterium]